MPIWDFYCSICQTTKELWIRNREDVDTQTCDTCGAKLERQPAVSGFVVNGYNYKNGYSGRK